MEENIDEMDNLDENIKDILKNKTIDEIQIEIGNKNETDILTTGAITTTTSAATTARAANLTRFRPDRNSSTQAGLCGIT